MEAMEFMRKRKRMCEYYGDDTCVCEDSRGACPAINMDCSFATEKPEQLVAVVEQWAKEHTEGKEAATTPMNNEPCVKTIRDNLEGATYRAIASNKTKIEKLEYDVYVVRHTLAALHDKIFALSAKIDHTPTMESGQTPEQKRTNKDVLLAAFPDAYVYPGGIPMACPLSLNKHYECSKSKNCEECITTYWPAEVEE